MNSNGMVNYSALRKNRAGLDNYLKKTGAVSKVEFSSWSEKAQISFLVNVYNAETLQLIIDDYPVDSIKDIGGFLGSPWLQKCVDLFRRKDNARSDREENDYQKLRRTANAFRIGLRGGRVSATATRGNSSVEI